MNTALHEPVMLREVVAALHPQDGETIMDATAGAGGYTRAILDAARCRVAAFDRDATAISRAQGWAGAYGDRLILLNAAFADVHDALSDVGIDGLDGAVFDLGVSSMQLDEAERGFSFRNDGPLSMRMDGGEPNAADVVNGADEDDLATIFRVYGEERRARQFARIIARERQNARIVTTGALADLISRHTPAAKRAKIHPATRIFQALRIFVNDELGQLVRALTAVESILRPAARLVVVTFHSLEDRIVKRFLAERSGRIPGGSRHAPAIATADPSFRLLYAKALEPGEDEVSRNPRARSAKLRAAIRLDAPSLTSMDFAPPTLSLSNPAAFWRD